MKPLALLGLLLGVLVCGSNSQAQTKVPKDDTQSWNDFQVAIPLTKRAEFVLLGTLRIGNNLTTFVDEREGVRFDYLIQKYVTLQTYTFIATPSRQMENTSAKSV